MIAVNLVLLGIVSTLIINTILDKIHHQKQIRIMMNQVQKQNEDIKHISEIADDNTRISDKLVSLIGQQAKTFKTDIANIDHDMSGVIDMIKHITESQQKVMLAHNEITNFVIDEVTRIWCDICEEDCSTCPFEGKCKRMEPNTENISSPFTPEGYDETGSVGSITIDPKNEKDLDTLSNQMRDFGLPQEVIDKYINELKGKIIPSLPKDQVRLDVVWKSQPIPINKNKDHLIDPNSKIVKTLNELYKNSN